MNKLSTTHCSTFGVTIQFEGTVEELKAKLNERKGSKFKVEWISDQEFKFLAFTSIGTLIVQGMPGAIDGIKGYGKIKKSEGDFVIIDLSTKLRVEIYFFVFIFSMFFLTTAIMKAYIPIWLLVFTPIILVGYWFMLRKQEIALFEKVKNYLKD